MSETISLSEKLKSEGDRILNIFNGFSDDQWGLEIYTENSVWTVRDILSHFITSERGLLQLFKQILFGDTGVDENFSIDRYNASQQAKQKGLSSAELLKQYRDVRLNSIAWVSTLDDSDLDKTGRHPFLGKTNLREMIKMLYLHNQIHLRDIKRTLDRQKPVDRSGSK
jgi:uncharacterized damage-inducible protein DinB